jgi:signal transduction histidine kinase
MKTGKIKISAILTASVLAVLGLVVFQLSWMRYSRHLSEEIFNQRASMALCSTVENYGGGVLCSANDSGGSCCLPGNTSEGFIVPEDLANDTSFRSDLRQALAFYQIDHDYELAFSKEKISSGQPFQCAVSLPTNGGQNTFVNLTFPQKEKFILGKMNYMVLATILILLFTTVVLLTANWSLLKQKQLLHTNIDFFNNMAHEFRTPLANMSLAVNMLSKKHQQLQSEPLVDILRKENTRLLTEVERVLHIASLDDGDFGLQKEKLPLENLLQSVLDGMKMPLIERQAQVILEKMPPDFAVHGDRQHLGNVFRNLLDNALKYSTENPVIRISTKELDRGILISVQDNGIGIPAGQNNIIFEKFQRVSKDNLPYQKGFGLGLAYVKRIVELHKGFVSVSSEENQGSRFDIFLPSIA